MNAWINISAFDIESIGHNLDGKMEKCSFTNARNMFFEGKIAIKKYA